MSGKYDDILDLPHPVSEKHAPMSMIDRAAQFSPFAALTGFDGAIRETARLTDRPFLPTESAMEEINEKLCLLQETGDSQSRVRITYFEKDERKAGGAYLTVSGCIEKIDPVNQGLILDQGLEIGFEQIYELEIL